MPKSAMLPFMPAQFQEGPVWKEVAPGVWGNQAAGHDRRLNGRATVKSHPAETLTAAAQSSPRLDRLKLLGPASLPFDLKTVNIQRTGERSVVTLPLAPGEKIFGLGLQMEGSDRRGGVYHLRVDHFASGHDRLHAPTPLYVSSRGYAVFFNTIRPIDVYVGVGNRLNDAHRPAARDRNTDPHWDSQPDSGQVEASVAGNQLEVLVMAGPTAMNALQRYNLYCGGGPMPPAWALGFWHRSPLTATAQEVQGEIDEYEKRGFPLDVIGLEPGWQSSSYPGTMEWSPVRFPDPKAFVASAKTKGVHVNLWENPYVAPGSDLFKLLDPNFGSHTVWLGAVPDLAVDEAATKIREFHQTHHVALGVSGYKIDEVDGFDNWLWPDHATFPSGLDGLRMRQIYGVLWQRELDRMFRDSGERTFGLVRGSNGAASRFPFAIYSDTYDQHQYVTASTNAPLAGVIWCAEAREAASPEEWVRRMQSTCLSPIAQLNAWSSGTKPWSYPEATEAVKKAMLLRSSLFPYLYTAFAEYWLDGVPPVRPMSLVDGGTETDQYMLGDDLLVAPMFSGDKERKVRLPKGKWFDYQTGKLVGDGETITVKPALDEIPLFARAGACIPTIHPTLHVGLSGLKEPIEWKKFGEGDWTGRMYTDDGHSFGYEKGDFGLYEVTLKQEGQLQFRTLAGRRSAPRN